MKRNKLGQFKSKMRLGFGIAWLIWLSILILGGLYVQSKQPLVSPLSVGNFEVHAQESVIIKCELGVPEYLECQAAKGRITYKQAEIMTAIAKAESNLNEKAKNKKSTARGIFQIIAGTWYSNDCTGDKYNWKDNTECAIKIMKSSGFYPWEVFNNGSYKKFLNK